jgi:hypothetical protein
MPINHPLPEFLVSPCKVCDDLAEGTCNPSESPCPVMEERQDEWLLIETLFEKGRESDAILERCPSKELDQVVRVLRTFAEVTRLMWDERNALRACYTDLLVETEMVGEAAAEPDADPGEEPDEELREPTEPMDPDVDVGGAPIFNVSPSVLGAFKRSRHD